MTELTVKEIRSEATPGLVLRRIYQKRLKTNPAYTLREFARELDVSHTLLSLIFSKKRHVSYQQALNFATKLSMKSEQKKAWFEVVLAGLPKKGKGIKKLQSSIQFDYGKGSVLDSPMDRAEWREELPEHLATWYSLALLDLTFVKDFDRSPKWVAERLGISEKLAQDTIDALLSIGLLQEKSGKLVKAYSHLNLPHRPKSRTTKKIQKQMIEKALRELETDEEPDMPTSRKITGMTFSIRTERLEQAFKKIEKFKLEMAELLSKGSSDSVYQMNIQLYPLVETKTKKD